MRHFCEIDHCSKQEIDLILDQAITWKSSGLSSHYHLAEGRNIALMFDKNSTRTRISFHVAAQQLGLGVIELDGQKMHFSQGKETLQDTARMLSSFVDLVMWRTDDPYKMVTLYQNLTIPLINGLTDYSHPCQIMAELMTIKECLGDYSGKKVLWCGDYNNVARSWKQAAQILDFSLILASPPAFAISAAECEEAQQVGADITCATDAMAAAFGVDVVVSDVWVSMGDQQEQERIAALSAYQVNSALMKQAAEHAIFLHCLPAVRGQEVTEDVLDGLQSAAWQEAENRLHVQKAIIAWCLGLIG